jgi:hypothetical protein
MNETTPTIQNTLEKALIKSIDGIEKTGTELIEALYQQAPEVVEQLLMWHSVESLIQCIAAILVLAVPFVYYKIACYIHQKFKVAKVEDYLGFWMPNIFISVFVIVFTGGCFAAYINIKWIKIWLAPKVYLLEYLAEMMK